MTAHMLANEAAAPGPGHNNPPPEPFDLSAKEIGDLYEECALWADGKPIETDEQAADAAALLRLMQAAKDRADERRVEEKRPHDEAAAAVQEKYAPLVADTKKVKGKAVRAIETMKALIGAHLAKKAAEQKRIADEARAEADRQREAAQKAVREADRTNLAAREAAEKQLADAQAAEAAATKLGKQRAQAKGFAGRAVSTTTRYVPTITDKEKFLRWVWKHRHDALSAFLASTADEVARTERRDVDGLKVEPKQVAI